MQRSMAGMRRAGLGAIILLSVFLDFWRLSQNGFGNLYYAAAVKSMTQSWQHFFFVSFDPGGFISVDKPPLGFWIQTLSAWIFGFKGWSILAPEALAGVAAVVLLYLIISKVHGTGPALLAAFLLAITPISVATSRNNTIDSILVVAMLAATWMLIRAMDGGRLKWLLLSAALMGVAFNVKFAEAFVALPAFIVAYLFVKGLSTRKKLLHLFLAATVLTAVSFSWCVAVDAIPAQARPWVGSTTTNSEVNLAIGYDGLQRVIGRFNPSLRGIRRFPVAGQSTAADRFAAGSGGFPGGFRPGDFPARFRKDFQAFRGGPFGGARQGGLAGFLRLFTGSLGTQIGWWLPLALLALPLAIIGYRRRPFLPPTAWPSVVLWSGWLVTTTVFFTLDPPLHVYYLVTMAPAVAAMVGIGAAEAGRVVRGRAARIAGLALLLVAMAVYQLQLVWSYADLRTPFAWLIGGAVLLTLVAYVGWQAQKDGKTRRLLGWAGVALALFGLTVAPAYWSGVTLTYAANGSDPVAGPSTSREGGAAATSTAATQKLVRFLKAHYHGGYLLATVNANTAAPVILQTGLPVMAMGGFLGTDPAIQPAGLQQLVKSGKLTYFLIPTAPTSRTGTARTRQAFGGFLGSNSSNEQKLLAWIRQHAKLVPASEWQVSGTKTATRFNGFGGFGGPGGESDQLYEYTGSTSK